MNNAFPILSLPPKVLTNALKCMDYVDVWSFSFVSKRTKSLTISLGRCVSYFGLLVGNVFQVRLIFGDPWKSLRFNLSQANRNLRAPLTIAENVEVEYGLGGVDELYLWRKEGYQIRDWIDHLLSVTNRSQVCQFRFIAQEERISNESIKTSMEGLNIQVCETPSQCSARYLQSIIETFTPRRLEVLHIPSPIPISMHKCFMHNFDELIIHSKLRLNDLLTMNSKRIRLYSNRDDSLDILNKFIKLWKTGSNSRLEYMRIVLRDNLVFNDLNYFLSGINHDVIESDELRHVKTHGGVEVVNGGYDIHGPNGRKATFSLRLRSCEIIVWAL